MQSFERVQSSFESAVRVCIPPTDKTVDNTWFFALNYAAAHHLVMVLDIVWTWGALFYLLFPALEITSPKAWLCAHYGYCSLQFCGICFFAVVFL